MNGHFFNGRIYYKGRSYLDTKEKIDSFFNDRVTKPNVLLIPKTFNSVNIVNVTGI